MSAPEPHASPAAVPQAARSLRENRLAGETSPYLLQHKHNPVDWWPWGSQALEEAKRTSKPILLSVGYAACHWCHVMAHESFEDEATAKVMNELFVNIKVDREERPDIDQIYMSALHLLGEHGGWPLTMFLTPAGEPFWGGTYFPNESRYGKPAFVDVLRHVARIFREQPNSIEQNRSALMGRLAESARPKGRVVVGAAELDRAARELANFIDAVNGGTRGAPKFPQPMLLEFLWRAGQRTGEPRYFNAVTLTLEHICQGGIYDHLGGGFSRYSVDEHWLVPHFEKMLYDNAQLLELLALAYQRSGNSLFRERAEETVGWLSREMTTPQGAFCASLDADSEGEEGKFYIWSLGELEQALGPEDAAFFAEQYDVTRQGNFEGHNILNRLRQIGRGTDGDAVRLAELRKKLLAVRENRVRPGLDDKVLADWNGLMIAGLVNAGVLLDRHPWIEMAARAFLCISARMSHGDRLGHSWREGKLLFPGLASDHANMIRAALALHEATGEHDYLERALAWQATLERHYANPATGGYYLTADDAEGLVVRPNSTADEATPNPNSVAAQNLVRLALVSGQEAWRAKADRLFEGVLPLAHDNFFMHLTLFNALDLRLRAAEIVIAGSGTRAAALTAAALELPHTERIVLRARSADGLPSDHPAQAKLAAATEQAAFVCVGGRCSLPVTEPAALAEAVAAMRG
jgi:uncharacterized protein